MDVDVRALGGHLASLAWVALRSFFVTFLVLVLAGGALAGVSYYVLREDAWPYGAIAVILTLVESLVVGLILGAKRALVMAVAHGLGVLRLGRSIVRLVLERKNATQSPTKRNLVDVRDNF